MDYRGKVVNSVVVLENGDTLPEGTLVRVQPVEEPAPWGEVFEDLSGRAEGLPCDLAQNHDHYLHGAPKQ